MRRLTLVAFAMLPLLAGCGTVSVGVGVGGGSGGIGVGASASVPVGGRITQPKAVVSMFAIDANGVGEQIGTIMLMDSRGGLRMVPAVGSLPPGPHGFHVHENPDCRAGLKDGKMAAGMAAGGHFDPAATGKHEGPLGNGHRGDLPVLIVDPAGNATETMHALHLSVNDLRGRAIIIHEGADNYSDQPKPLGGGGARIACGVVPAAE